MSIPIGLGGGKASMPSLIRFLVQNRTRVKSGNAPDPHCIKMPGCAIAFPGLITMARIEKIVGWLAKE
jgi:hypothetical protein